MFFASLLAMVIAGIILVGVTIGGIAAIVSTAKKSKDIEPTKSSSILVLDLDKTFHEQHEKASFFFGDEDSYQTGLYELQNALKKAKTDKDIKGLLIKTDGGSNSWATLQQVRNAVADFKASGKFVYAYGESISQRDYYVASLADSVFLNPIGDMELKGLAAQLAFFKGTLDKLGVKPEIFYAGRFKSATEPFRATEMSPANRIQLAAILSNTWSEIANAAALHAKTDTATVRRWTQTGEIQFPEDALSHHLVDGLRYWDEVEATLRSKTGKKADEKIAYTDLAKYASKVDDEDLKDSRIAVLFAEGDIVDGKRNEDYQIASETFMETLRKVRDNDKIKAVVLRINSPGGSARASEILLREIQLLKKKKPVVVSMGDVAASGGYYLSCQADSIFAMPTTITGSIGVFSMLFSTQDLMTNKLGVTFDAEKTAPYADFPSGTRPMTADEAARMQRDVDTIYSIFKRRVVAGRSRKLTDMAVDSIAQGRVWSGRDALAIGLVDGLGDLNRAIQSAARLGKLSEYSVTTYPEPVDKFESLMRRFKGNSSAAAAVKTALKEELGTNVDFLRAFGDLRRMNGKSQASMPFRMVID